MIGVIFYLVAAPLRICFGLLRAMDRSSNRRSYRGPRGNHYSHGYCDIAHRTQGAADRCSVSGTYRKVEALAIARERQAQAEHNAWMARKLADEAYRRGQWVGFRRRHATALRVLSWVSAVVSLVSLAVGVYLVCFTDNAVPFILALVGTFVGWLVHLNFCHQAGETL